MIYLAQEIWDKVVRDLPSFSARVTAQIFGFKLGNRMLDNHSRVWDTIFRDQTWALKAREAGLNPTLIGSNLIAYYKYQRAPNTSYMCLWSGPDSRWMRRAFLCSPENFELFLKCLKPHYFDQSTWEVNFDCGITLNVSDIRNGDGRLVVAPTRLLSYRSHGFRSGYLLWEDNTNDLRQIDSHSDRNDVVDESGYPATKLSDVREMCRIKLRCLDGSTERVELLDPEEKKRQVADFETHCRWDPILGSIDLDEGSKSEPESSARDLPIRQNKAAPFPNRVIKHSKKSKRPKARLVSRLAQHFRKGESRPANTTADLENEMDLDEIY